MGSDASNSGRDPLTALLDRQAFWKSIQHRPPEWLPAWRLGLAFIDLDRLKGFNEAHGQAMGDAALQCVARAITSPLRPYEWASRYGGDEFAVLLALGDRSEAVVWADATRSRIVAATTEEFATGLDVRVGIAVGSAGWWPSAIYTEAILPADAALGDAVRNEPPRRVVVQTLRPRSRASAIARVCHVGFRIDETELAQALDRRVLAALAGSARTWSISDHFDYLHSVERADLSRDAALAALVESANDALHQFSDDLSEDAREPYDGCVTIDGDLLQVRFGRVPRSSPDDGDLAPELEPIPIGDILIENRSSADDPP